MSKENAELADNRVKATNIVAELEEFISTLCVKHYQISQIGAYSDKVFHKLHDSRHSLAEAIIKNLIE